MSTQYRLVQSGKTASGGCSAGQGSSEPVAPRIYFFFFYLMVRRGVLFEVQTEILNTIETSFGFEGSIVYVKS
jgi:hypothetical protein